MARKKQAARLEDISQVFQFFSEIHITQMLSNSEMVRVMPHQLTPSQFALLSHFSRSENLERSIVELAKIFQVSKPSMGETVSKLHQKGFIKIQPNPDDLRGKIVSLTKKGSAAKIDAEKAVYPFIAKMIEEIGMEQFELAFDALKPIRFWMDNNRNILP